MEVVWGAVPPCVSLADSLRLCARVAALVQASCAEAALQYYVVLLLLVPKAQLCQALARVLCT